jgi:hypothetical protein
MNGTDYISTTEAYEDEGGLDPREAARMLEETRRQAQRGLDFKSPWLSLLAAAAVLVAFGSVWLSVRGQHPYKYPTVGGLLGLYAVLAVRIGSVVYAHRRASAGVSGRSVRQRRAEGVALAVALVAVYVIMGALASAGASDGVVYGVYTATATMLVLGTFGAVRSAIREDWLELGISIAVIVVAAGSAFAGPRGVWLSNGVGLCVVLLVTSAVQAWLLHASRSDA